MAAKCSPDAPRMVPKRSGRHLEGDLEAKNKQRTSSYRFWDPNLAKIEPKIGTQNLLKWNPKLSKIDKKSSRNGLEGIWKATWKQKIGKERFQIDFGSQTYPKLNPKFVKIDTKIVPNQ